MHWMLFLVMIFMSTLQAQSERPALFSSIGEHVYLSADGYEKLLEQDYFSQEYSEMEAYVLHARELQRRGLTLDKQSNKQSRSDYVNALRDLDKQTVAIEYKIKDDLQRLLREKNYALLQALKNNPLEYVRDSVAVRSAVSGVILVAHETNTIDSESNTSREFNALKASLLQARDTGNESAQCLNDITAVVYWIQEVDRLENEPCKAVHACDQVHRFVKAAKTSCTKEHPLYIKWSEASQNYRTKLKDNFNHKCNNS